MRFVDAVRREAGRGAGADSDQLALDVLLDSIDHLRAAALSALTANHPKLAEMLCAPLEASRPAKKPENPPPAPK